MVKINKEKQAAVPQKLLREVFDYNELTGKWIWIKKPHPKANNIKVGQPAGTVNKDGYVQIGINGYTCLAHRLAWTYIHGDYPDGEQPYIDHINGDKADNRIENLRVSSGAENGRNQGMKSNNTSGVIGIRREGKWSGTKIKKNWYWVAYWCDENSTKREKGFNIEKLGEDKAKQLAIEYRAEQVRLLALNYGIVYSDRHGIKIY